MCTPWLYSHTVVAHRSIEHVYIHMEYVDVRKVKVVYDPSAGRSDFVCYYNRREDTEFDTEAELFRSIDGSYRPVVTNQILVAYRR